VATIKESLFKGKQQQKALTDSEVTKKQTEDMGEH